MNTRLPRAPVKTGEVYMVQVQNEEGLANHLGPESCVGSREAVGEALTGEVQAGLLSRESINSVSRPDVLGNSEGNTGARVIVTGLILVVYTTELGL